MAGGVLLAINCQEDLLYAHRRLITAMYSDRFDKICFIVNDTCETDPSFESIVVRWQCPPYNPARRCSGTEAHYGVHAVDVHMRQARLVELAQASEGYEAVVFSDTDCIMSPALDADAIRQRCAVFDAITPPIRHYARDDRSWLWASHESGYPSLDRVARCLDRDRLLRHWRQFQGCPIDPESPHPFVPMFAGFSDWLAFDAGFLRRAARDFLVLQQVWHEAAIPTAILHNTSRIQVATCQVLWGSDRYVSLPELMKRVPDHDFIHPIKFGRYGSQVLDQYREVQAKMSKVEGMLDQGGANEKEPAGPAGNVAVNGT